MTVLGSRTMLLEIMWSRVVLMPRDEVQPREDPVLDAFLLATIAFLLLYDENQLSKCIFCQVDFT